MGKQNRKSLLIHAGIIMLSSLVVVLPEASEVLAQYIDPATAALLINFVGIAIKKIIDTTE